MSFSVTFWYVNHNFVCFWGGILFCVVHRVFVHLFLAFSILFFAKLRWSSSGEPSHRWPFAKPPGALAFRAPTSAFQLSKQITCWFSSKTWGSLHPSLALANADESRSWLQNTLWSMWKRPGWIRLQNMSPPLFKKKTWPTTNKWVVVNPETYSKTKKHRPLGVLAVWKSSSWNDVSTQNNKQKSKELSFHVPLSATLPCTVVACRRSEVMVVCGFLSLRILLKKSEKRFAESLFVISMSNSFGNALQRMVFFSLYRYWFGNVSERLARSLSVFQSLPRSQPRLGRLLKGATPPRTLGHAQTAGPRRSPKKNGFTPLRFLLFRAWWKMKI